MMSHKANESSRRKPKCRLILALLLIGLCFTACQSASEEKCVAFSFEDEPIVVVGTVPQLAQIEDISFENEPLVVIGKIPRLAMQTEISFENEPLVVMGRIAKRISRFNFEDEPLTIYGESEKSNHPNKIVRAQLASNKSY